MKTSDRTDLETLAMPEDGKVRLSYKTYRWLGSLQKPSLGGKHAALPTTADLNGLIRSSIERIESFVRKPCPAT